MNKEGIQKGVLRLAGAFEILAFIAVVMPRSWMEISHEWLGLGQMPHGPVLMFLIRQASYTYGMHGVYLWVGLGREPLSSAYHSKWKSSPSSFPHHAQGRVPI